MHLVKRFIARTWLATIIVLAAWFAVSYFRENTDALARIAAADKRYLGVAALAQFLYFLATVLTWQKALRFATTRSISFREGLTQILLVNFGKYIPGKVWGLAARGARLKELGFTIDQISSISYLEQILLLLTGFSLAFLAAAIAFQNILFVLLMLLATLAIVLFRSGSALAHRLSKLIPGARWLQQVFDINVDTRQILSLTLGYLVVWLLLTITFMMVCMSIISVELTVQSVATFLLSLTSGFLAGFLAIFAPGGFGIREGVGAAFLTTIVTLEEALMLMLLFRVWVMIWELVAGSIVVTSVLRHVSARKGPGVGEE
jgi:uncharacterized membrane protein YbhN (UPF0104 family)